LGEFSVLTLNNHRNTLWLPEITPDADCLIEAGPRGFTLLSGFGADIIETKPK
jgi:hypothetical protein